MCEERTYGTCRSNCVVVHTSRRRFDGCIFPSPGVENSPSGHSDGDFIMHLLQPALGISCADLLDFHRIADPFVVRVPCADRS